MLFPIVFIFVVGSVKASSFEYSSPQLSDIKNSLDPIEVSNRRHTKKIIECEDFFQSVGLNELQHLIEAIASKKEIKPFIVLRMLYKRIKNKEESSAMDGIQSPDILNPPLNSPFRLPPAANKAPYSISVNPEDDTKVVIIPMAPHSKDETETNGAPPVRIQPGPLQTNNFRPPLGAIVRLNCGDIRNPINRDITIPVSPLMTILEALRQAETKFQNILGLSPDMDVITFSLSSDCYLVNKIHNVEKRADFGWKIIITDREGHVQYNDFCLPKDILVKPETIISLSYVPIYPLL